MAGVAVHGSEMQQVFKNGHVTFQERVWEDTGYDECTGGYDEEGYCQGWSDIYDWRYYSGTTNAKINGTVSSSSNVYVNGIPIAFVSSQTIEQWVANPAPTPIRGGTIVNISPSLSGSGSGSITSGNNSSVYVNGQPVATIGSTVTTHLGNTTIISTGSSNVFIG